MITTYQTSQYVQTSVPAGPVNFCIGQPSPRLMPLKLVQECTGVALAECATMPGGQSGEKLQYGAAEGTDTFRNAVCQLLSANLPPGHDTAANKAFAVPENIFLSNGNSSAVPFVLKNVMPPGATVLVDDPTYFLAGKMVTSLGFRVVRVQATVEGVLDLDSVDAACRELADSAHPVKGMYLVPVHHNPLGTSLGAEQRTRLASLARQHDFWCVCDEPYPLLYFSEGAPPALVYEEVNVPEAERRIVSLGSFSKIVAPGLRCGWVHGPTSVVEACTSDGTIVSGGGMNPLAAGAMAHMILSGKMCPHLDEMRKIYKARMDGLIAAALEECGDYVEVPCTPKGGYFVTLRLKENVKLSAAQLKEAAGKFDVVFLPADNCSVGRLNSAGGGSKGPSKQISVAAQGNGWAEHEARLKRCLRVSFAFYQDEEARVGFQRLKAAIEAAA